MSGNSSASLRGRLGHRVRDFHFPGRSVARGLRGAAATSHQRATLAAVEVLRGGGNAVDAALTACALQAVIEPNNTGLGGDCFAFVWSAAERRLHAYNGSGFAPAGLSAAFLRDQGCDVVASDSVHSITVPGAVDAWSSLLAAHGSIAWRDMLAPAIEAASDGFILHDRTAHDWAGDGRLARDPGAAASLLFSGAPPAAGDIIAFPLLARTLKRLADEGRDAFYEGGIAGDLVASLKELGGRHELADFAAFRTQTVTPISTDYQGLRVHQIPPNGQGITALIMLNILSGFDYAGMDPAGADRFHLQIEASRLAYAARDAFVADPAHAAVAVDELLSESYARELRSLIDPARRSTAPLPPPRIAHKDTICLTVADAAGNVCSLINSLFHGFGSGKVCPRTGVTFQNRGHGFTLEQGHPNELAPRKRPMHTIIPGFVTKDDQPYLSYGVMGGAYQPVGHVQVLENVARFGMDIQEAIDMPRGLLTDAGFEAESAVAESVLQDLASRGHSVRRAAQPWGGGQAILFDPVRGSLAAASDGRKDGCALAY